MKNIVIAILSVTLLVQIYIYVDRPIKYHEYEPKNDIIPYTFRVDRNHVNIDGKAIKLSDSIPAIKISKDTKFEVVLPYDKDLELNSETSKLISKEVILPNSYRFMLSNNSEHEVSVFRFTFKTKDVIGRDKISFSLDGKSYVIEIEVTR